MSILPSNLQDAIQRENSTIAALMAVWSAGTGIVMIFNWQTIGQTQAWQPAKFGGDGRIIIVYGVLFLVCCPPLVVFARWPSRWRAGVMAAFVAGFTSAFLALMLVIEAIQSGQGWLGALNYVLIAGIVSVVIRSTLREHPFGGP
jgi:hypothetical protein